MVARRRFTLTPPRIPESALHQQVARILSVEIAAPGRISQYGVTWFSIDIANYGGTTPGLRTSRGVIAGIPDMVVIYRGGAHWIEIKARGGSLSTAQIAVGSAILLAGAHFGIATSVEHVLELLDCWEIPRSKRLRIADKRA